MRPPSQGCEHYTRANVYDDMQLHKLPSCIQRKSCVQCDGKLNLVLPCTSEGAAVCDSCPFGYCGELQHLQQLESQVIKVRLLELLS
jgi:hypothetical protein